MSGNTSTVSITVPGYPSSNLVPGVYAVVDASQANTASVVQRVLIVGQMLTGSLGVPNVPVLSTSPQAATAAYGAGSQLAEMLWHYRQIDTFTEVWLLPLLDDTASTAATGSILFVGPSTGSGTLSLRVGGQLVPIAVTVGMTAAQMATAFVAAMALVPSLPVTGVATAATVALTAKNKGALGNDVDIRLNYLGAAGGEVTPAGVNVTVTPMSGGTQNPTTIPLALANLSSQAFDFIAFPYTDTTSLNSIEEYLNDTTGRWSWEQQLFGGAFSAIRGTVAARQTFGAARDDQHTAVLGFYDSPSTVWAWCAEFTAACASSIQASPAVPITQIVLQVLAPPVPSQDELTERQTLLTSGVGTFIVNAANQVVIERVVTTYTTNPGTGAPDNSYRDVETLFTLMAIIRDLRIFLQTSFARRILVADGTLIPGGSNQVTSQTILAAINARYVTYCSQGLAQNATLFAQASIAQNAGGGLVKCQLPVMVANQLRVIALDVQFSKP